MKLLRRLLCVSPLFLISSNINAELLVDLKEFPDWFNDAAKREIDIKNETPFEIESFNVKGTIKGSATLQSAEDGVWYYLSDIGTDSPVECYVFTSFDGTANSLHSVMEYSLGGVETLNNKKLSSTFNYAIDVGMVDDTPYLALDTLYNLSDGKQTVTGVLKGKSAKTTSGLNMCIHNEIGYDEAFSAVFESFVSAFTQSEADPEFYQAAYKMIVNGTAMGYALETYSVDEDGDVFTYSEDAMIMPVDAQSISRSDSVVTEYSRPDGSLINGEVYNVENGEVGSQFAIVYKDNGWQVSGQLQGKEIATTLEHNTSLLSNFGSYLETAKLMNSEQDEGSYTVFMADVNPTAVVNVGLKKIKANEKANLELVLGPLKMTTLVGNDGGLVNATFSQGPINFNIERMFVSGAPKLP